MDEDVVKVRLRKGAINHIYNERRDFILIGLTGRTGSGCSTVANILKNPFSKLELTDPTMSNSRTNEDRKYSVIYNYARANWDKYYFSTIQVANIIASFVYEDTYDNFIKYIGELIKSDTLNLELDNLKAEFNYLHDKLVALKSTTDAYDREVVTVCDLFMWRIPAFSQKLKDVMSRHTVAVKNGESCMNARLYTYFFQHVGMNVRSSGNPYSSDYNQEVHSENMFIIADRINKVVKAHREKCQLDGAPTLVCIDAIRNKYEGIFFQERYSNFFLLSINTEEAHRLKRLSKLTAEEIESMDKIEYGEGDTLEESFYKQNIKDCIEIADIHIHNPTTTDETFIYLTKQLVKYISLIMHPGLVTPNHIERCMQIAYNAKMNSGCLSRQVGAVITDDNYSIKAIGWNSVPEGQVECNLRDIRELYVNKNPSEYSHFEITNEKFKYLTKQLVDRISYDNIKGRLYPYCFKDCYNAIKDKENQVHTRSLHAEENAFLQITKYGGEGIKGGFLFTTASPCELCSKKAYQLGIRTIYYIDPYPGISQEHILNFEIKNNPQLSLFQGAVSRAYTILYSQIMPIKDELALMTKISKKEMHTIINGNKP